MSLAASSARTGGSTSPGAASTSSGTSLSPYPLTSSAKASRPASAVAASQEYADAGANTARPG